MDVLAVESKIWGCLLAWKSIHVFYSEVHVVVMGGYNVSD